MKLQIKTAHKQLVVDIDKQKTVYDVKHELSLFPDIGVQPELQKLIYDGKELCNDDQLIKCNIDTKKFFIMIFKEPESKAIPKSSKLKIVANDVKEDITAISSSTSLEDVITKSDKKEQQPSYGTTPVECVKKINVIEPDVDKIVSMGYSENEARRALVASNNTIERAVEYLIEKQLGNVLSATVGADGGGSIVGNKSIENTDEYDGWTDDEDGPLEKICNNPWFPLLRHTIMHNPELLEVIVKTFCVDKPTLLSIIDSSHEEFLKELIGDDSEDGLDDSNDDNDNEC